MLLLLTTLALAQVPAEAPAQAGGPFAEITSFSATYEVAFDMDATGDRMCPMTHICDCSASYTASGTKIAEDATTVTFQGAFTAGETECYPGFSFWTGGDGKAFHTLTFDDNGVVSMWVVHGSRENSAKRTEGIKASGQYWIDDLALAWKKGKPAATAQTGSGDLGQGLQLGNSHTATFTFK
jgi:hypothetical protein